MSKTVYLGTSSYAAVVLELLANSKHRPKLVVSLPDSRQGRGRKLKPPPVAQRAAELGIDCIQPESVNSDDARGQIAAAAPEVVCVCAYGQLIKEPLLSDYLMLNVHPSLLPRWRGAAPIERAVATGDSETGVTVMRLVEELDAGPIAARTSLKIESEWDCGELTDKLANSGGELLVEVLDQLEESPIAFVEQNDDEATYAEKITSAERRIDLTQSAEVVVNWIRALTPHIGAYVEDSLGQRLKLIKAEVAVRTLPIGQCLVENGTLLIGCGDRSIEVLKLQPPSGKPTATADYLRGHTSPAQFNS